MKKRIKTLHEDNRHTTKPYNEFMWDRYEYKYYRFNTEELARQYNVSKRTIYHWNVEMKKKMEKRNQALINSCKTVEDILKEK